jgi:hypothetical protein
MSYSPNNINVYLQAFAGAVAGLLGQSTPLGTVSGSYTATITIAGAWAQEVDTQWDSTANPDQFRFDEIYVFSNDLFQVYEPQPNTTPAMFAKSAQALFVLMTDAETYLTAQGIPIPRLPGGNYGFITADSTSNGQGVGGPTIVAVVGLAAKGSGIFDWKASADQAAAAATEVVTWDVTSQTGVVPFASTGSTNAKGASADGATAGLVSNGVAGTGIVITAGGGGELTQDHYVHTVGTAAVGSRYSGGGTMQNSVTAVNTRTPFPLNNNVILVLKITNSATNRVVSNINMSLSERPS